MDSTVSVEFESFIYQSPLRLIFSKMTWTSNLSVAQDRPFDFGFDSLSSFSHWPQKMNLHFQIFGPGSHAVNSLGPRIKRGSAQPSDH